MSGYTQPHEGIGTKRRKFITERAETIISYDEPREVFATKRRKLNSGRAENSFSNEEVGHQGIGLWS